MSTASFIWESFFTNTTSTSDWMRDLEILMEPSFISILETPTRNTSVLKKIKKRGWREPHLDKYLKGKLSKLHGSLYNNHRRERVKREPHSRRRK